MKARLFKSKLKALGANFEREGSNHEIWKLKNGKKIQVPRHHEINDKLAERLIKEAKG